MLLKEKAVRLSPDLVIIAYSLNDLTLGFDGTVLTISRRLKLLARHSILYKIIANRINNWAMYRNFKMKERMKFEERNKTKGKIKNDRAHKHRIDGSREMFEQYAEGSSCWEYTKLFLERIFIFAQKNNFKVAIVIVPFLENLQNYPYLEIHRKVKDYTEGLGFPVFDLFPFYKTEQEELLWVSTVDFHPNRKANIIAANALAEFISNNFIMN